MFGCCAHRFALFRRPDIVKLRLGHSVSVEDPPHTSGTDIGSDFWPLQTSMPGCQDMADCVAPKRKHPAQVRSRQCRDGAEYAPGKRYLIGMHPGNGLWGDAGMSGCLLQKIGSVLWRPVRQPEKADWLSAELTGLSTVRVDPKIPAAV